MAKRAALRASDRDREQVAERLRQAAVEGRLLAEELEHRLARALRARTYGELDPLVADLPGGRTGVEPRRRAVPFPVLAVAGPVVVGTVLLVLVALAVLVMAGFFMVWAVWVFFAWWLFHRGHGYGRRPYGYDARRHIRMAQRHVRMAQRHARMAHRRTLL